MRVENAVNIADLGVLARRRLPKVIFDFMDGGAEDEVTLRGNREGFERYRFRPRLLTGNAKRDLSINLFGDKFMMPFMIGPTGLNGIHWRGGDLALANAAAAAGCGFVLSTASTDSIEEVGQSSPSPKWFQLYPWGDHAFRTRMMERARSSGYKALVVTVDSLTGGRRERDARNNFAHEVRLSPSIVLDGLMHPRWLTSVWLGGGGMPRVSNVAEFCPPGATAHDLAEFTRSMRNPGLTWDDMALMKKEWGGPFLVKGVLTAEDARHALDIGADGVVVSNHGGRQLDNCIATIDALPEIVEAVGHSLVVLIDGGFRRGSDIVKALALGAKGVLLGRATLYGLAAGGQPGVAKSLSILRDEVDRVFALLGCSEVSELTGNHVAVVTQVK
jgi:(S)-mandelate dehydrogenase